MQDNNIIVDTDSQAKSNSISNNKSSSKSSSKSNNKSNSNVEFLSDKRSNGKERPWKEKKINSRFLSEVYMHTGSKSSDKTVREKYERKAETVGGCGDYLIFAVNKNEGKKKLLRGSFCKKRLCPMCAWRRSLKLYNDVRSIMEYINHYSGSKYPKAKFLFATLTMKNVKADELSQAISDLSRAFVNLLRKGKLSKSVVGAYRGIEITYNPNTDEYHPHIHAILMVTSSYFSSSAYYVTHKELCELWGKKLKVNYIPVCDIRLIKNDIAKSVAEVAKYSVKDNDYLKHSDIDMSSELTEVFEKALYRKRLVSFYGIMKDVKNLLNIGDVESDDVDLVKTSKKLDADNLPDGWIKETFKFTVGYNNYIKQLL